jgi:hypothetical protein
MNVDVVYLIPYLRLRIGDTDPTAYRYLDEWLTSALVASVKSLGRYWGNRYLINDLGIVSRNPVHYNYISTEEFGVIDGQDEDIIILKAAIILLEGNLETSAWNVVSWRDSEISFSNLEQSRSRNSNLDRFKAELGELITSPGKRLAVPSKQSLPGYLHNPYENKDVI